MEFIKEYDNGLKLVVKKMDGLLSVATGIFVKAGSRFEEKEENGISHFIEHNMFKGTNKRTAFQISDDIDSIGSNINAFTSKECTCYYTLSTFEHQDETFEILADIFLNSTFPEEEVEKERGVIIEEVNMTEDTPDEVCFDLLATASYGDTGLGQTILGPIENINRFTREDIKKYIDKYYTPDNVTVSIAGAVDIEKTVNKFEELFSSLINSTAKSEKTKKQEKVTAENLYKVKDIEQAHIAFSLPALPLGHKDSEALKIATIILGGGMSSRLFQKVREEMALCYTVYAYPTFYENSGKIEIYAGVNPEKRDDAVEAIKAVIKDFAENGITEKEFIRGREQMKSAFILSQESTSSQMRIYGKECMYFSKTFDMNKKIEEINSITIDKINDVIKGIYSNTNFATATVGKKETPIK